MSSFKTSQENIKKINTQILNLVIISRDAEAVITSSIYLPSTETKKKKISIETTIKSD